jgi:hypothetical protein
MQGGVRHAPLSIRRTEAKASSAWSRDPYLSYRIPMPYQSLGSSWKWLVTRHGLWERRWDHLGIRKVIECLLIGAVGLLQVILHQKAMA